MWLWRVVRRMGRIGIGLIGFVVGSATLTATMLLNMWLTDHLFWHAWLLAGLGGAVGTFAAFERFGFVPEDDWDPPTTLSLHGAAGDPHAPVADSRSIGEDIGKDPGPVGTRRRSSVRG